MTTNRTTFLVWTAVFGVMSGLSVFAGNQAETPRADERASETRQVKALEAVCGSCHGVDLVSGFRPKAEWRSIVDSMKSMGATGSDEEFALVDAYIAQHVTSVNVNTAPPDELAPVLDVDAGGAEAIVKYRGEHGAFKTADDLKNVPGIAADKVDARKDRLRF